MDTQPQAAPAQQKTVLVVDDDDTLASAFKMAFVVNGMQVITAHNGEEALKIAKENKPDAILLDLMMPIMDGKEFLRHRQTDPDLANIPVIVCSALIEQLEKDEVMQLGADGYVQKAQSDPDQLFAAIQNVLGSPKPAA